MELQKAGAVALTDDGRPVENSLLMAEAMKEAASLGLRVVSHCEDLYLSQGGLMNEGAVSRELNVPGVPAASENAATARESRAGGILWRPDSYLPCEHGGERRHDP